MDSSTCPLPAKKHTIICYNNKDVFSVLKCAEMYNWVQSEWRKYAKLAPLVAKTLYMSGRGNKNKVKRSQRCFSSEENEVRYPESYIYSVETKSQEPSNKAFLVRNMVRGYKVCIFLQRKRGQVP